MGRGQSLVIPPYFDGTNYAYWKVHMKAFLKSLRKILRILPKQFCAKTTVIEEAKDIYKILVSEIVVNLRTYEMGLGKPGKNKTMALQIVDEEYDFFDDELSRAKGLLTGSLRSF